MAQKFILLACAFLIGGNCLAQDLIQTDRPDHTEGVFIIKKNTIQLESGFYHEVLKSKSSLMFVPTSLIKFGVSKNFET